MSERKPCVKCGRPIHSEARVCPYCNWWQSETPPVEAQPTPPAAAYVPPPEQQTRKKLFAAIGFVVLLIVAFAVGSLIHGFEPSDIKAAQDEIKHKNGEPVAAATDTTPATPAPKANVTLIPDNGAMSTAPPDQPMTSAPASPDSSTSTDATGMTSQQYAALAQKSKAQQQTTTVDPRSLTGNAYEPSSQTAQNAEMPPHPRKQMAQRRFVQVQPVPEYQPVPRLSARGTARLALTIDTNGRVQDVEVLRSAAGDMGRVIDAVQSWRFRPAMQNGQPVPARFTVDINFND